MPADFVTLEPKVLIYNSKLRFLILRKPRQQSPWSSFKELQT